LEDTFPAVGEKVAVLAPEATVTDNGTFKIAELLESATWAPFGGAPLLTVTVQLVALPESSVVGVHCRDDKVGVDIRLKELLLVAPFRVALTDEDWSEGMVPAVAVKVAEEAPEAIVAVEGTDNRAPLAKEMVIGDVVEALSERVQVLGSPEPRLVGLQAREERVGSGTTFREAVALLPLKEAVRETVWLLEAAPAVAENVVEVPLAGTVTVDGTVRTGEPD